METKTENRKRYAYIAVLVLLLAFAALIPAVPGYLNLLKGGGAGAYIRAGLSFIGNIGIYLSIAFMFYTGYKSESHSLLTSAELKYLSLSILLYVLPERVFVPYGQETVILCNAQSMNNTLIVIAVFLAIASGPLAGSARGRK